jgi:galactose-1-phosphate uridylyltransferase
VPLEFHRDGSELVWVRNPFTGTVTYFTHVHKKRSGFIRPPREALLGGRPEDPKEFENQMRHELAEARRTCPFCPGNEERAPAEVLHVRRREVFPEAADDGWLIRAVRNLIPRIPESCTGGRNESYVVIEDPRHFADDARGHEDLLYSGLLPLAQFEALLAANVEVTRRAYTNPAVRSVLVRKNQGRGSGASQPHLHNQVIGSDRVFPAIAAERGVLEREPRLWEEIIAFTREQGFMLREADGCCAYFCPFGVFPRSYEIVCPRDWVRMTDLPETRWKAFTALLHEVINLLGPMPLDYEIHEGPGVPLHAHVNARHFAYSNIGGTLNLPANLSPARPAR